MHRREQRLVRRHPRAEAQTHRGGLARLQRLVQCERHRGAGNRVPANPRAWLALTARRKALDALRRERLRPDRFPEAAATLGAWVAEGKLKHFEQYFDGLESSVDALNALFTGTNTGKVILRLPASDTTAEAGS